jgi:hypothetical protein
MSMTTEPVSQPSPVRPGKAALWTGRVLSWLIAALIMMGGVMNLMATPEMVKGAVDAGYPVSAVRPLGAIAVGCALLYAIPQTAVLGAILLSAYFGGAVATHMQIQDGLWWIAVVVGVVTWVALLLREPRLRTLAPIRTPG